eukprot:Colp12_sorted_trinity150504_noHs@19639
MFNMFEATLCFTTRTSCIYANACVNVYIVVCSHTSLFFHTGNLHTVWGSIRSCNYADTTSEQFTEKSLKDHSIGHVCNLELIKTKKGGLFANSVSDWEDRIIVGWLHTALGAVLGRMLLVLLVLPPMDACMNVEHEGMEVHSSFPLNFNVVVK